MDPTRRKVPRHSGMQCPLELMIIILLPPIGGWNGLPYLTLPGMIQLVLIDKCSRVGDWFRHKDRQPHQLKSGVIYSIKCSCESLYIGETERCLKTRFDDHCRTSGSNLTEVGKHLRDNPSCSLDFESQVRVIGRCNFSSRRKLLETLHLQEHRNNSRLLNDMQMSRPLFLFNI